MIDIDHFKQFNDFYGHLLGDHCLQEVAQALVNTPRRPEDFVARYGGEEFVVLLPNTGIEGAQVVAEAILKAVAELAIEHRGSPSGNVTVSIGCAHYLPSMAERYAILFQMADDALYLAKKAGRNRVEGIAPTV